MQSAETPELHDALELDSGGESAAVARLPGPLVRRLLLIAVLAVALAGCISAWVVAEASGAEVVDRMTAQQTDEVELVARLLASKIEQSQKVLSSMAEGITPTMLQSPTLLEWMLQQGLPAVRFFDAMEVARPDGTLILNLQNGRAEPASSLDASEREYLLRTMLQGKPLVSGVIGQTASNARVMFTMPLVGDNGKVIGVVSGVLRLQSQGLLPHSLGLPGREHSRLVVFNSEGVILSHPKRERVMGSIRNEPGLEHFYASKQAERKPISNSQADTENSAEHFVSIAGVPMPQWWVARVTDTPALLGPLGGSQRKSWWAAAMGVALVGLLAALAMVWTARPLIRLHGRAMGILGTPPGTPTQEVVAGEAALLEHALDHLVAQQEHHGHQAALSRMQLQSILEQAPTGIVITRGETLELLSQQASLMLGYARAELEGHSVRELFASEKQYQGLLQDMAYAAVIRGGYEGEIALRRKDATLLWARVVGRMGSGVHPEMAAVWVLEDITNARVEREQPLWASSHDPLTHLPNRAAFDERVNAMLLRSAHQAKTQAVQPGTEVQETGNAMLFIDLDHLTLVNDRAGHEAGDELLRQMASFMQELVRHVGWIARLGGDEFAVVLPDCSAERAQLVAEHIRSAIAGREFSINGQTVECSVSIGIVVAPCGLTDVTPWLRAADMACYFAKRAGRDRVMLRQIADRAVEA